MASPPTAAEIDGGRLAGQVRLACKGTMVTPDQAAPGPVISSGTIDFAGRQVLGFGMGSQPIVVLTASEIDFGSRPPEGSVGMIVEGSIDRRSGATQVVVRSAGDPDGYLIDTRLHCESDGPIS